MTYLQIHYRHDLYVKKCQYTPSTADDTTQCKDYTVR